MIRSADVLAPWVGSPPWVTVMVDVLSAVPRSPNRYRPEAFSGAAAARSAPSWWTATVPVGIPPPGATVRMAAVRFTVWARVVAAVGRWR